MSSIRLFNHYTSPVQLLLGLMEGVLIFSVLVLCAQALAPVPAGASLLHNATPLLVLTVLFMLGCGAMGLYSPEVLNDSYLAAAKRLLVGGACAALGWFVLRELIPTYAATPGVTLATGGVALASLLLVRGLVVPQLKSANKLRRRVLIVGAGKRAEAVVARMMRRAESKNIHVVGFVPTAGDSVAIPASRRQKVRTSIADLAQELRVQEIVLLSDNPSWTLPADDAIECRYAQVQVSTGLEFFEQRLRLIDLQMLQLDPIQDWRGFRVSWLRDGLKRAFDLVVAVLISILALPLMLLTAIAIKLEDGLRAPVLYSQIRVGRGGRSFRIYKFRSMRIDAEADGQARWATQDDPRITRVGAFIRLSRLDELPQLLNVLRGDMTLVGPRPERPEFVGEFQQSIPFYAQRHRVRPGLTGWAQLCYPYGDSAADAWEKLQFDLYYVKNQSFFLDMIILFRTAEVVLFGRGAR